MKTRIVEREDMKVFPSVNAIHGPKGFLGNQELGGGLQFCIIEEVCDGDSKLCGKCRDCDGCESDSSRKTSQGRSVGHL